MKRRYMHAKTRELREFEVGEPAPLILKTISPPPVSLRPLWLPADEPFVPQRPHDLVPGVWWLDDEEAREDTR